MKWKRGLMSVLISLIILFSGCTNIPADEEPENLLEPTPIPPEIGAIPPFYDDLPIIPSSPPPNEILFLIDSSKSVQDLCSPEEQNIASHAPAMVISLFKSLSEYYGDDTRFKVGVLAFTSLVEPSKSPFIPIQTATSFPDDFVERYNDYSDVVDNENGNDFPEALEWGINTLINSTINNCSFAKII